MHSYVLDTNIIMSMLISGKSHYIKLLSFYEFVSPQYLLIELDEYKSIIEEKSIMKHIQLQNFVYSLFSNLTIIPTIYLSLNSLQEAYKFCKNVDIKDISFVALSIETSFPLITRDERLFKGLKTQGFRNVILFQDFLKNIYEV